MSRSKVYISSTFKDLESYRKLIEDSIEREFSVAFELSKIMEHMFDDGNSTPFIEDCVDEVKQSDVYLLILGNRIGSVPPSSTKTYTEIEYETALQNEKRVFRFVNKNFKKEECDDVEKYNAFKSKLEGLPYHEFSDIQSFENKFLRCMSYLLQEPRTKANDRKFYYILAAILGLITVVVTYVTYSITKDFEYALGITLLVPLLFSCIILYTLKNVLFPTALTTIKN